MNRLRIFTSMRFLLLWLGLLFVFGCSATPGLEPTISPLESLGSPLETPDSWAPPSPGPDMAVITGQLIDQLTQKAPLEGTIYLGSVAYLDNDQPVVKLDRETAPFTMPTQEGYFLFEDVEPGEYGLILYTPEISFLIDDPDGGGSLLIKVDANEVRDLGRLEISLP